MLLSQLRMTGRESWVRSVVLPEPGGPMRRMAEDLEVGMEERIMVFVCRWLCSFVG